jgi:hypothetical protein
MKLLLRGLLIAVVLTTMGCTLLPNNAISKPLACEQIVEAQLYTAPFSANANEFGKWIKANYAQGNLYGVGGGPRFDWTYNGREYLAPDTQRILIKLKQEPTISNMLSCFGEPEVYSLRRMTGLDQEGVDLSIWYPRKGLMFSYTKYGSFTQTFDSDSVLNQVLVFQPGERKVVISRLAGAAYQVSEEQALNNWPQPFRVLSLK